MCKYCEQFETVKGYSEEELFWIDPKINLLSVEVKDDYDEIIGYAHANFAINFCPMCGQALKERNTE